MTLVDIRTNVEVIQWSRYPNYAIYMYAPDRVKNIMKEVNSYYKLYLESNNLE